MLGNDDEVKSEPDLGEPSAELLEWARNKIGEDPNTKCQHIQELRDMIYEKGECDPPRRDNSFLLRFLRARHFSIERSHRLLVNYCDFRNNNPEIIKGVNLAQLSKTYEDGIFTVPPYRDQAGRRMLLYRIGNWDPTIFTMTELFQVSLITLELAVLEQRTQILGGNCICDFSGLSLQQAYCLTPSVVSIIIKLMGAAFPIKLYALHIVNQSYMFDIVFNVMKSFLNDAMMKRIFFHGSDMESLHKHIEPKYLPEKYGGVHPDYNHNDWIKHFKGSPTIQKEFLSLYPIEDEERQKQELFVEQ